MKKLSSIILSVTMLLSIATAALADEATTKGTIAVGINAEYAPFEYYDDSELTGFDIDLMNYIGERIGYDIEYVDMSFDKLIPAVVSGEVACAISTISQTDERREIIDFSRPYLRARITYNDGEASTRNTEYYSIVFKEGMSDTLLKSSFPTEEEQIYLLITDALDDLISDGTVDKLIEKYNLNNAPEETEYHYEYDTVKGSRTPSAKTDNEVLKSEDVMVTVPAPSDWARESVDIANDLGITYTSQQYLYHNNITREEFCELIYNLVILVNKNADSFIPDSFTDTKNEKVLRLNSMGIISGKTETEFAPNDYLTREEAAAIIMRMINKVMPMPATEMWFEYDDTDEISDWASDSIQTISNLGFMKGVGDNKFAPKDTYTTEQAIATLVRVYEGAESAGAIDRNANLGIIGGADGPTQIIIGENVNVIESEEYEDFYADVSKNTIEVNDFYVDEAIRLISESGKLAADKNFIGLYTANDDITEKISSLSTVDFNKPTDVFYLSADREQIIANIKTMSEEAEVDIEDFGNARFEYLWRILDFYAIASMVNASYGSENLAALTILTNSRGYITPKDFKNNFTLFLQYDGEYSALVSFSEYGEGVISANMSFVKNGDKDNIFRRIYEITQGFGENSIDVAKVK